MTPGLEVACSKHTMFEFIFLREMGQTKNKIESLNFRKANFQLYRKLVKKKKKKKKEIVLMCRGAEQNCQIFNELFLSAQELFIPR